MYMRITNVIQDYIESKVRQAYKGQFDEIESQLEKATKTIDDMFTEAKAAVADVVKKYFDDDLSKKYIYIHIDTSNYGRDIYFSDEYARIRDKKNDVERKIGKKTKEIGIELALGGTKKDLDRLISEIKVEE